jgi:hypothetical protein
MTALPSREECLDGAAQAYVDAVAARDSMTPEAAAKAALPTGTPAQVAALAEQIRADRQPLASTA